MKISTKLKSLLSYLTVQQRIKSSLFIIVSLTAGASEALTITALNQWLLSLNTNQNANSHTFMNSENIYKLSENLNISPSILSGSIFFFFILISSGLRLWALRMSAYLPASIVYNLNFEIYRQFVSQTYDDIKKSSIDHLVNLYSKEVIRVGEYFTSVYNIVTAFLISTSIIVTLFIIDTFSIISILLIFCATYFLAVARNTPLLNKNGSIVTCNNYEQLKTIRQTFNAASDFKLYSLQDSYLTYFRSKEIELRDSIAQSAFLAISPKYVIEPVILISVIISTIVFSASGEFISTLGTIILGLQKLLPSLNIVYSSFANIKMNQSAFKEVENIKHIYSSDISYTESSNFKALEINNVDIITAKYLSYKIARGDLFKDLNLTIKPGTHIGIIGQSGTGKSTLLRIVAGLSESSSSSASAVIKFKSKSKKKEINLYSSEWRDNIAYMPQNPYLFSDSILYNITLNKCHDSIDFQLLELCLDSVLLTKTVDDLPYKLLTNISNDDNQLSGGQKQRLCIARSLYSKRNILIFDESTSSLDPSTEVNILNNIFNSFKDITVIAITHRIDSLHLFDEILRLNHGMLDKVDNRAVYLDYLDN